MDLATVAAAGLFGIVGALAGTAMSYLLDRKARREDERRHWELERLAKAETYLKRLAARITLCLTVPNLLSHYLAVATLRDLMYVSPLGLDNAAIRELLDVLQEATVQRSFVDAFRHWVLGDTRRSQALLERLVAAETALAVSIRARRTELLGERADSSAGIP